MSEPSSNTVPPTPNELTDRPLICCCAGLALGCYVSNVLHTVSFVAGFAILVARLVKGSHARPGTEPAPIRRELARLPGLEVPLALYVLSFLVSSALGMFPSVSFSYVTEFKRIAVAFLVASAIRSWRDLKLLLSAVLAGACLTTVYAFFQYFHGGEITRMRVTVHFEPFELAQPFGFASSCNDLGGLLILALGVALGPVLFGTMRASRRWSLGALSFVIGAGVLRTLSRSSTVGALAGIMATGLVLGRTRRLFAFILALVCMYPLLPRSLTIRHHQFVDPNAIPNKFRLRMFEVSAAMARDHLPWGIGRRNFEEVHRRMCKPGEEVSPNAHNNYLTVLVEQGILGLVSLVWIQVAFFVYLAQKLRSKALEPAEKTVMAGLFMGLASFTVAGLFDFYWGFSLPVTVMWIFVGAVYAIGEGRTSPPAEV